MTNFDQHCCQNQEDLHRNQTSFKEDNEQLLRLETANIQLALLLRHLKLKTCSSTLSRHNFKLVVAPEIRKTLLCSSQPFISI